MRALFYYFALAALAVTVVLTLVGQRRERARLKRTEVLRFLADRADKATQVPSSWSTDWWPDGDSRGELLRNLRPVHATADSAIDATGRPLALFVFPVWGCPEVLNEIDEYAAALRKRQVPSVLALVDADEAQVKHFAASTRIDVPLALAGPQAGASALCRFKDRSLCQQLILFDEAERVVVRTLLPTVLTPAEAKEELLDRALPKSLEVT